MVLPDGTKEATPLGVPQGGPLSPLLANPAAAGSQMSLVRHALNNRWLEEQGVPDMRAVWIKLHYGPLARV